MTFVHPWLLWGLSLVAIPIIIHLFNFRRYKTVYFTNVQFLKEVTEETAVRSKVKHWLVLLSRILAVAFLVLAFAQPFIPLNDNAAAESVKKGVSIYLDNSFSMLAEADDEKLLNRAQRKAREIVNAYSAETRFQLLTNEFTSRQQRFVSKEEMLSMLDEVTSSSTGRMLDEVYSMQKKSFSENSIEEKNAFWISDFQKSMVDFKGDTAINLSLLPLQPVKQQNLYIDSVWLLQPVVYLEQAARLVVKIVNSSDRNIEGSRLTLSVNNQVKAIADFSVQSNASTVDTISFSVREPGFARAEVAITDYPVTFDDTYFLSFKVTGQVDVLAINENAESKYLQALYANTEKFVFQNQLSTRLDYSSLKNFSLIVLNNLSSIPSGLAYELSQYLDKGGVLLIFPNSKADVLSYNKFFSDVKINRIAGVESMEQPVTYLNREHELFTDVFEEIPYNISLPSVKLYFTTIKQVQSSEQALLGFRDGTSFISRFDVGRGKIYWCASPLDENYSDFPMHALFVPMLYKMALSGGTSGKPSYILGKDDVIEVENKLGSPDDIFKMRGTDIEVIPKQKAVGSIVLLSPGDQVSQAGVYNVYTHNEKEGELVALNYDRSESRLEYYDASELKDLFPQENIRILDTVSASLTEVVQEMQQGIVLWKLCIILALVFLGAEVLLLRFLK